MSMDAAIAAGLRAYLLRSGTPVAENRDIYSWSAYSRTRGMWEHMRTCSWVIPAGTTLREETYYVFDGTFTGCKPEVGLEADGCGCACGEYTGVTLRVVDTLGNAIRAVLNIPNGEVFQL